AEDALRQSQKMEAVGQLTGGLAHDFNNLLTGISGSLELLGARVRQGRIDDIERYIVAAQGAAKRAAALTHRLLAFSRRQTLDPRPTDVNRLVHDMADLIRRTVGPEITLEVVGTVGLWAALVDPNQLENALLNLAINARDAMPDGGPLRIEAAAVDRPAAGTLAEGKYIRIAVIDRGVGMESETLARAVEPFFSTKGVGKGTGLGLSMVHGLAAQLGGMLTLTSDPGQGTTAEILLPTTTEIPGETDHDEVNLQVAVGHATILLVDDEELVREGTAEMLRDIGYHLLTAASGGEALSLLRGDNGIDLVISDYLMPGMNGVDLIQRARAIAPEVPALLITGYSNIASGPGADLPRLAKPFRQVDLAARVVELLGQRSAQGSDVVPIRGRRNQP
ncbi:MAG: response regulator, partial [Pseudomonadota bacterium]|nr:response regulator [Pseudomonadota bacterium]